MPKLIADRDTFRRMIARRRRMGADRFDEVWDGVYVMSPIADNEHQFLAMEIAAVLRNFVRPEIGERVFPGCNISDQPDGWTHNYRCPDVAVFLSGNTAEDRLTHWYGGPDLAVEILSPKDRSRRKLSFYARVGVRELWLVDRRRWAVEVYHRDGLTMTKRTEAVVSGTDAISVVLPLRVSLRDGEPRPVIVLRRTDGPGQWIV